MSDDPSNRDNNKKPSNVVSLTLARLDKKKAGIGGREKPLYPADLVPLLDHIDDLTKEVDSLRDSLVKLLRLLKNRD